MDNIFVLSHIVMPGSKIFYKSPGVFTSDKQSAYLFFTRNEALKVQSIYSQEIDLQIEER